MLGEVLEQIDDALATLSSEAGSRLEGWLSVRDPVSFRAMELEVAALARATSDAVTALVLRAIVSDPEMRAQAAAAVREASPGKYRHGGRRTVHVTLLGGMEVPLQVDYFKVNRRNAVRKRRHGDRGKGGSGLYPVLSALGIHLGVTPALAGEVCRQVTDSDSVRAGRSALARRGIDVRHERTLRLVNQTSHRMVEQRNRWLQRVRDAPAQAGPLAHKRVVVALDGGRLRERKPAQRGRRRARTGHRRYDTPWREPKQLVIYAVDGRTGEVDPSFEPVYDATLGDSDALFAMVAGYLRALGAHQASRLIFVGDGAKWIWERTDSLADELGVPKPKRVEVIDWFHAVEVLHTIAEIPTRWSATERERWVRRAETALHKGQLDRVVAMIDELAVGRRSRTLAKHREYFVRNQARMQYAAFKRQHLPLGSGAVESAIRRVVNQRMKASGSFWLEQNAEGMLLLRSYLKCGRLDDLLDWSFAMAAPWWPPARACRDLDRGPLLHAQRNDA